MDPYGTPGVIFLVDEQTLLDTPLRSCEKHIQSDYYELKKSCVIPRTP